MLGRKERPQAEGRGYAKTQKHKSSWVTQGYVNKASEIAVFIQHTGGRARESYHFENEDCFVTLGRIPCTTARVYTALFN